MGGGLMQLVAYGAQDVYLTGNPQITFFKVVYRRHTNFSIETVEHTLGGNPDFGRKATVTVTRNGDLATKMYLRVVLKGDVTNGSNWAYVTRLGHALMKSVELEIGGSKIDKQYGTWLDIWYELTAPSGTARGYNRMIGNVSELTDMASTHGEYTMYIPLQFWFCRNTGLALPLIALQYHEVRVHFEFANASELVRYNTAGSVPAIGMKDASLLVDYIYLDSEERRRFAQVGHEYLIEQLQFTGEESARDNVQKYKLGFNHPTKELVWAAKSGRFMGKTFLAENVDDLAKQVVLAKFALDTDGVTAAATIGLTPTAVAWDEAVTGGEKLTVDNDATDVLDLIFNTNAKVTVGGTDLFSLIDGATVHANDNGVTVTSVSHRLTQVELSQHLGESGVVDGRIASSGNSTQASPLGSGVVVNHHSNYGIFMDGSRNPVTEALVQLNGHDRFDKREGDYFNYVQPGQHHSNTPADGVNVYSFAIHPEQHQPSGTANLSRIDNTQLNVWYDTSAGIDFIDAANKLYVFGFSYNVLRVMSGMGGLAYSN